MNYKIVGLILLNLGLLCGGITLWILYRLNYKYKSLSLGLLGLSLCIVGIVLITKYTSYSLSSGAGPHSPVPGPHSPVPGPHSPVPGPHSPVPGPWDGIDYKPYLSSVYPAMDKNKTQKEYQDLFHSLGWYYQCCDRNYNSYNNPIVSDIKGPNDEIANRLRYPTRSIKSESPNGNALWYPLKCCKDNDYKLPTIPRGYLYDWHSLQYFNVPIIISNETGYNFANQDPVKGNHRDIATYSSQSAGTGFVGNIISENGTFAKILISDPMGLQSKIPVGLWAGPGPFYAGSRAIMKAMYYPFGPQYLPHKNRWIYNGEPDYTKWLNMYLTKSELETKTNKDHNTNKYWCNGFDEDDFAEIGHVEQIPGLPQSTGYWYNYFGGGGTGIFHKFGKTPTITQGEVNAMKASLPTYETLNIDITGVSPRNKAHALFNLLWEIKHSTNIQKSGGPNFRNITDGSTLLRKFYGTDDPWIITMWYANGYAYFEEGNDVKWTQYKDYNIQGNPMPDFNGFSFPVSWALPAWQWGAGPNQKLTTRQVCTSFILSLPQLGAYTLPDPEPGNASLSNLYGVSTNTTSGVTFATLCAFLLQAEFGPDRIAELADYVDPPARDDYGMYNTLPNLAYKPQFPKNHGDQIGIGALTYKGVKYALTKVFMGNYFYDRVSNGVSFDEPINYFASVLGYKDIQMPCNPNSSGFWSFESIYVGLPNKANLPSCDKWAYTWYKTLVEKRQYAFITAGQYQSPAMIILNKLWGTTNSMRDPFDVKSETKSMICYGAGGFPCNGTPGTECKQTSKLNVNDAYGTDYNNNYYGGTCKTQNNVGMNKSSTSDVIWDEKGYCHHPWGQNTFGRKEDNNLWPGMCCMGQSFCQVPGGKPTLSAIWNNVPYGKLGYGNGLVTLYPKKSIINQLSATQLSTQPPKHLPVISSQPPPLLYGDPRLLI